MQPPSRKIKSNLHMTFTEARTGRALPLDVGEELGHGSMSIVCAGIVSGKSGQAAVAVKILRPSLVSTPAAERFVRESRLLCELSHPNIVRGLGTGAIRDDGEGGRPDVPVLVMERVEGTPLDELIRERTFASDPHAALELLVGISSALGYLHLDGRVQAHRDVKPANIIVRADGVPKLIDLGVAKTHLVANRAVETKLAGTVRYMAPEQLADSSRVDTRSDIYALGLVLLEMLGCAQAHGGDGRAALAARFARTPPRLADGDARRLGLGGSHRDAVDALLARMCAYEPHDRFQTPRDLTRGVQETLGELERDPRPATRRRIRMVTVGAACAAAALLAVTLLAGHDPAASVPKAQPPIGREIVVG